MKILIIRHGEPDYSIDSLTEKGWREAELLSKRMAKLQIDDMYVSPLGRARDTAKPTEKILNKKAAVLPWLAEFAGEIVSPYTGENRIPWDLAPGLWGNEERYYDRNRWTEPELINTGDSGDVYESTKKGIDELLQKYGLYRHGMIYRNENKSEPVIALFCHCVMGLTIVSYLTGVSPFVLWHNFFLPTSSVSTIVTETDKEGFSHFRCMQIGDTSHLYIADEPISMSGLYPEFEF